MVQQLKFILLCKKEKCKKEKKIISFHTIINEFNFSLDLMRFVN